MLQVGLKSIRCAPVTLDHKSAPADSLAGGCRMVWMLFRSFCGEKPYQLALSRFARSYGVVCSLHYLIQSLIETPNHLGSGLAPLKAILNHR